MNKPGVIFEYSAEDECGRVGYTLKKYQWYKDNGYNPRYPKAIQDKFERGEMVTDKDIPDAVATEFDAKSYSEHIKEIEEKWGKIKEKFFEDLRTLGLPTQSRYEVMITKYGTAGSYGVPNSVQLSFYQKDPAYTLAHEIVHLTIEHLIQQYGIDHWTKERLVDLIMNKFFPENRKFQRDSKNTEKASEIFEKEFPNIEKIISEVSNLR